MSKTIKSSAKAAGLKSAFVLNNDEVLLTSFGRGNDAIIEKKITSTGEITSLAEKEAFSLAKSDKDKRLSIISKRAKGVTDNPQSNSESFRDNIVRTKGLLEEKYFGRTFDDNIHIQLINCILDIKKILAVHTNNIVYAINNIRREENSSNTDLIGTGYFNLQNSYENFISNEKNSKNLRNFVKRDTLSYFSDIFYRVPTKKEVEKHQSNGEKAPQLIKKDEKEIYYILCMINELRQVCVHHTEFGDAVKSRNQRYSNLYDFGKNLPEDARDVLDRIYRSKLSTLNSFSNQSSRKNFKIIFDVLGVNSDSQKREIAQQYYNFTIRKTYKNIGFSIKNLREVIIDDFRKDVRDTKYDSVRSKLNNILDFAIWHLYNQNPQWQEEFIANLRACSTDDEKAKLYLNEAEQVNKLLSKKIGSLLYFCRQIGNKHSDVSFPLSEEEQKLVSRAINEVKINDNVSYFSKFIYLLTLFLDGKEINDLLTTLINKFDNIAAFEKVILNECGSLKFVDAFEFFNPEKFLDENCKSAITSELVDINSFARMGKTENLPKTAYKEAAFLLGTSLTDEQLDDYVYDTFIDKEKAPKLIDKKGKEKPDMGRRNFIINNVLKSWRFNYIARYTNPYKMRKCIENPVIVKFVLEKMEDTIIDRYASVCFDDNLSKRAEKINALTDLLSKEMSIDYAIDVNQKVNSARDKNKQRKIAAVSLYLNVLYQIAKNLVYINSRYVMAFHALERDSYLYGFNINDDNDSDRYTHLIEKAIQEGWLNKRATAYLTKNKENSDYSFIKAFRNKTVHLNAIRNIDLYIDNITRIESYFELYHYIMQHDIVSAVAGMVKSGIEPASKLEYKYVKLVKANSWYVKDFIKALCIPFGYNLVRYKNLSIDILFDRNDTRERKKVKIED